MKLHSLMALGLCQGLNKHMCSTIIPPSKCAGLQNKTATKQNQTKTILSSEILRTFHLGYFHSPAALEAHTSAAEKQPAFLKCSREELGAGISPEFSACSSTGMPETICRGLSNIQQQGKCRLANHCLPFFSFTSLNHVSFLYNNSTAQK